LSSTAFLIKGFSFTETLVRGERRSPQKAKLEILGFSFTETLVRGERRSPQKAKLEILGFSLILLSRIKPTTFW